MIDSSSSSHLFSIAGLLGALWACDVIRAVMTSPLQHQPSLPIATGFNSTYDYKNANQTTTVTWLNATTSLDDLNATTESVEYTTVASLSRVMTTDILSTVPVTSKETFQTSPSAMFFGHVTATSANQDKDEKERTASASANTKRPAIAIVNSSTAVNRE
jgi:hypothetical protein